ncbi:4'-phosphopantetheinyl transferase family protein [Kitasatospora sp. NPDC052896]|uniref:4'-phosphopantetheinyl transferase family protein n=1 Tax=Kitasatospora sp. NPDC052896 TaxID=3364061 RepID=UPI0037C4F2C5
MELIPVAGAGLDAAEAEVWWVAVDPESTAAAEAGEAVLSAAERERAAAFARPVDRALYRVAHVALRVVLGSCLGIPAGEVSFSRAVCPGCGGPHGRPEVVGGGVDFSLTHATGAAVIALARRPVGVDVEQRAAFAGPAGLEVGGQLHPAEQAELAVLPVAERADGLLRCWTRKEAYLKGVGIGIAYGVAEPYVGTGGQPSAPSGWALVDVPSAPGYGTALALHLPPDHPEGAPITVHTRELPASALR